MEHAALADDLRVSRIALGCEPLGGTDWGTIDVSAITAAVHRALDEGIDFFDTADVYGLGRSEERLADILGSRRHDVAIATKVGVAWDDAVNGGRARTRRDLSPAWLRTAVEGSLRRLRLDRLPLLYLHWPDAATPLESTLGEIARLHDAGMIGHLGLSNFSAADIERANALFPVACVQTQFSLLDRRAASDVLPRTRALGIPVFAYGPLAQGLLGGRYDQRSSFAEDDRRHRLPHFAPGERERGLATVSRARAFGESHGVTPACVAIRWVLEQPGIAGAIVGAKSPEQAAENASAGRWRAPATLQDWFDAEMESPAAASAQTGAR